ncbi:Ubiquinone biosynthesis O-methyltransferase, mitochondrial [Candidatus Lokiarchaeum ossiferum]|uniref:Ubiquinone biosynthesis O-methyltransferase, mitochondrial n=1 Tax=Candidatus Lokiarchaeum ossiferum TaxID=2951803 RepID=A0ABY6HQ37_9ARCH|nr:Ubiquinone biosynthesis O-methyltransferase, mitochondrial [Candidatus Lokiarchaeum sp. B-35]
MVNLLWKLMAKRYDRQFKSLYKSIIPLITGSVSYEDNVIELGCGSGLISIPVLSIVKKFIGIDLDEKMIKVANRKLELLDDPSLDAQFIVSDASNPTLDDLAMKYDKIIVVNLLHVVESPSEILLEAKSMLKRNGQILVVDFCHGEKMGFKYALMSKLMNLGAKIGLMEKLWRFTFSDIRKLIEKVGLKIKQQEIFHAKFPFVFMKIGF